MPLTEPRTRQAHLSVIEQVDRSIHPPIGAHRYDPVKSPPIVGSVLDDQNQVLIPWASTGLTDSPPHPLPLANLETRVSVQITLFGHDFSYQLTPSGVPRPYDFSKSVLSLATFTRSRQGLG